MFHLKLPNFTQTFAEGNEEEFYLLWLMAAVTYGIGDIVTTVAIIELENSVRETNPLLLYLTSNIGYAGLVGLKIAAFLVCIAVTIFALRKNWPLFYYIPPIALTAIGLGLTVFNLSLLTVI